MKISSQPTVDIDLLAYRVLKSCAVVMGLMHPERASNYRTGWTKELPNIDDEPFEAKPPKKTKKLAKVPTFADAMATRNGEFPEGDA